MGIMNRNLVSGYSVIVVLALLGLGCSRLGGKGEKIDVEVNPSNSASTNSDQGTQRAALVTSKARAWELGNKLSLAGVLYEAQGITHDESLSVAKPLAIMFGAEVPAFPAKTGNASSDGAAILAYLLNGPGKKIGEKIREKHDQDHSDLYEMALKSNILLMLYGPGDSLGKATAKSITKAGERSKLPKPCWQGLIVKIDIEAPYDDVKEEIFDMQKNVGEYLNRVLDPSEPKREAC